MCLGCLHQKWDECTCEDYRMNEYDLDMIADGKYDEDNCPFFVPYWANEKDPYQRPEKARVGE